jgi:hypothetical protein
MDELRRPNPSCRQHRSEAPQRAILAYFVGHVQNYTVLPRGPVQAASDHRHGSFWNRAIWNSASLESGVLLSNNVSDCAAYSLADAKGALVDGQWLRVGYGLATCPAGE